jgi:hypothetical protein
MSQITLEQANEIQLNAFNIIKKICSDLKDYDTVQMHCFMQAAAYHLIISQCAAGMDLDEFIGILKDGVNKLNNNELIGVQINEQGE